MDRAALLAQLKREVFAPGRLARSAPRYGIEAEVLVLDASDLAPLPGPFPDAHAHPILAHLADLPGWQAGFSQAGSPTVRTGAGGVVSLEPGGQLEYSSAPRANVADLLTEMAEAGRALEGASSANGLTVVTRGIDPVNPVEVYPLAVGSTRYLRLARHLASFGPAGARMMRQTASIQVNLSWGDSPLMEWDAANRVSPYLLALFANSPRYGGKATGHRSFRALQWRELDPARTGVPLDPDRPVEAYLDFALDAGAILLGDPGEETIPFGRWLGTEGVTLRDWRTHLTTLFPEVRPRGYMELRGLDALPIRWWAVPLAITAGLLRDSGNLREIVATLGVPPPSLLLRAGRDGLQDPEIASGAAWVWDMGLAGCARLPGDGWSALAALARRFDEEVRSGGLVKGPVEGIGSPVADPGARAESGDPGGPVPFGAPLRSAR